MNEMEIMRVGAKGVEVSVKAAQDLTVAMVRLLLRIAEMTRARKQQKTAQSVLDAAMQRYLDAKIELWQAYVYENSLLVEDGTIKGFKYHADEFQRIEIRAKVQGKEIKAIDAEAFKGLDNIQSIWVGGNVKEVGKEAFADCKGAERITLSDGIEILGDKAFANCKAAEVISLSRTLKKMGKHCFENCESVKEINLPDTLHDIPEGAFAGCKSLETLHLPKELDTLGKDAFRGCESLTEVKLPSGLKDVPEGAFADCKSLKEIELPSSVKTVGLDAFAGCVALETVKLPDGIQKLDAGCFRDCKNLKEIELPINCTEIGDGAFAGCTNLESVRIPPSVSITKDTFADCDNLKKVYVPKGKDDQYKKLFPDSVEIVGYDPPDRLHVPHDQEKIGRSEFENFQHIKHVEINAECKEIGYHAFADCNNLETVRLPLDAKVDPFAFENCDQLKTVYVPKGKEEQYQKYFPKSVEIVGYDPPEQMHSNNKETQSASKGHTGGIPSQKMVDYAKSLGLTVDGQSAQTLSREIHDRKEVVAEAKIYYVKDPEKIPSDELKKTIAHRKDYQQTIEDKYGRKFNWKSFWAEPTQAQLNFAEKNGILEAGAKCSKGELSEMLAEKGFGQSYFDKIIKNDHSR